MTTFGEVQEEYRNTPVLVGPGPDPRFSVEFSDGHREIVEAPDEADAIRQANNAYCGPAFVVAVHLYERST